MASKGKIHNFYKTREMTFDNQLTQKAQAADNICNEVVFL